MGYDYHISRTEFWCDSEQKPITLAEWKKYVEQDNELKIDPVNNHDDDELMVLWYGEGNEPDDSDGITRFWFREGQIETKNPEPEIINKMLRIAAHFDAFVCGDDNDVIAPNGDMLDWQFVGESPGLWQRLTTWLTGTPLPEREGKWVVVDHWDG